MASMWDTLQQMSPLGALLMSADVAKKGMQEQVQMPPLTGRGWPEPKAVPPNQQQQQQPGGKIPDQLPQQGSGKDQSRLESDPNAPESPNYELGKMSEHARTSPGAEEEQDFGNLFSNFPGGETVPADFAAQSGQPTPSGVPSALPQGEDPKIALSRFLLQAGLSLMVGGNGNALSQIGTAVGRGAEANRRATQSQLDKEAEKRELSFKTRQQDISQQQADAASTRAQAAVESSRSRRLGKLSLEERATEGMSAEAQTYFRNRMKSFNKLLEPDEISGKAQADDPQVLYDQILQETQTVDFRVRAAKGELKAEEVSDESIAAVVADPTKEEILLNQVRADPIQLGLLRKRLEAARRQGNAGR